MRMLLGFVFGQHRLHPSGRKCMLLLQFGMRHDTGHAQETKCLGMLERVGAGAASVSDIQNDTLTLSLLDYCTHALLT